MEIENFSQAKAYAESLIPKNLAKDITKSAVGLNRIRALLEVMGNPQDAYPTIHVGGTAGKGSTATMIAAILQQSGYKVGLHLSPHLQDIRERAQVNGKLVSKADFVKEVKAVRRQVERTAREHPYGTPTYFEMLIALAFEHFKRRKVDVAVIEVGLGGTFDGTNVIKPKVAVLTNVGLDHTEILGNTIEEIARDKAGIFKRSIDVMSGVTQPSVVKIVRKKARDQKVRLDLLGVGTVYRIKENSTKGTVFDFRSGEAAYRNVSTRMIGRHQARNAALAIGAVLKMKRCGFEVSESDIRRALAMVNVPGRFEICTTRPIVILDGAHNPMKIETLVQTLNENYKGKRISVLFAAKKDKKVEEMLARLSEITSRFYFTRFEATTDFGRRMSYDPAELAVLTKVESETFDRASEAYEKALSAMGKKEILCVTGSLYLVGELRSLILR